MGGVWAAILISVVFVFAQLSEVLVAQTIRYWSSSYNEIIHGISGVREPSELLT